MDTRIRRLLGDLGLKWDHESLRVHLAPFTLGRCLADDGRMALVYEAVDQDSGREVVVKFPSPVTASSGAESMSDKIAALR